VASGVRRMGSPPPGAGISTRAGINRLAAGARRRLERALPAAARGRARAVPGAKTRPTALLLRAAGHDARHAHKLDATAARIVAPCLAWLAFAALALQAHAHWTAPRTARRDRMRAGIIRRGGSRNATAAVLDETALRLRLSEAPTRVCRRCAPRAHLHTPRHPCMQHGLSGSLVR